jgi:hypothetical protein
MAKNACNKYVSPIFVIRVNDIDKNQLISNLLSKNMKICFVMLSTSIAPRTQSSVRYASLASVKPWNDMYISC